ncbi:MAG: ATP-binding protein [Candidatus Thorarchaeota archaeon]
MSIFKHPSLERLEERIKFRMKVERAFGDISTYLVFSSNFEMAIDYFLSELAGLFHEFMVDSVIVCLFDEPANDQIMVFAWNSERILELGKDMNRFPIQNLPWLKQELREGREQIFNDVFTLSDEASAEKEYIQKTGIQTLIGMPIFTPEYLAGALILLNFISSRTWEEEELRTLRIFADILGTAIYRKKTEETLSKSRDYLKEQVTRKTKDLSAEKKRVELILNTIKDGVLVLDSDGIVTMVNETAKKYFHRIFQKDLLVGSNLVLSTGHPLFDTIRELFLSDNLREITIELKKGLHLQFVSAEGRFPELTELGKIIEFRDVTPFIEFDNMRKRFISTVSHELRTPITVINQSIGNYEKYGKKLPEETQGRLISAISRNAQLLHELIEDLLLISRIDERKVKFNWQHYHPKQILEDVLAQLEPRKKSKNLTISYAFTINSPLIGDPKRIAQVFRIILDNSIKYSNENGSINIEGIDNYEGEYNPQKKDCILIKFVDAGIGIHSDDLPKLFNRFFRSKQVDHIPGTGLGLEIAQELMKMHEGEIFVESTLGEGTTVFLLFPRLLKEYLGRISG